jgi:hypothetical protein
MNADAILEKLPEPHRSLALLLRRMAEATSGLSPPIQGLVLALCDRLGTRLCDEIEKLLNTNTNMPKKTLTKKEADVLRRDREHIEALSESIQEDQQTLRELQVVYAGKAQYCNHQLQGGKPAFQKDKAKCSCGQVHMICSICGYMSTPPSLAGAMAVPFQALKAILPPQVVEQLEAQMKAQGTLQPPSHDYKSATLGQVPRNN